MSDTAWHLDRKVPIALILALTVNIVVGIWWASKLDSRVGSIEKWIESNGRIDARLAVIEEQQKVIQKVVERIETRLDGGYVQPRRQGQ